MADLAIITPTRGRPVGFAELVQSVFATAGVETEVWAGLDYDDRTDYATAVQAVRPPAGGVIAVKGERRGLCQWTNFLADLALRAPRPPRYLASLGDDHRPRTPGWDRRLIDAIEATGRPGIAYGNDLFQGPALPTAWVMSAEVVRALGWMMMPMLEHMFVDNATLALGRKAACITYCPSVVVEHVHPLAGKAPMDASYRATNAAAKVAADQAVYEAWLRNGLAADAQRLVTACVAAG